MRDLCNLSASYLFLFEIFVQNGCSTNIQRTVVNSKFPSRGSDYNEVSGILDIKANSMAHPSASLLNHWHDLSISQVS